jgi:hypothetical protein
VVSPGQDPLGLQPRSSAFVTVGLRSGPDAALLLPWAARVLGLWRSQWYGTRALLLPLAGIVRSHPPGWKTVRISTSTSVVIDRAELAVEATKPREDRGASPS